MIALETKIAQGPLGARTPARRPGDQQPDGSRRAGQKPIPAVDWNVALEAGGLGQVQNFLVNEISALKDGAALLDSEPIGAWKKYLAFHLANRVRQPAAEGLRRRQLRLLQQDAARRRSAARPLEARHRAARHLIGEGVGEALRRATTSRRRTRRRWTSSSPTCATAMGERLKTLTWMDDATRAEALKKLATSSRASAIPIEVARLLGAAPSTRASCSRTCGAAAPSNGTARSRASARRSIATSGA